MISRNTTIAEAKALGQSHGEQDARYAVTKYLADPAETPTEFGARRLGMLMGRLATMRDAGIAVDLIEAYGEASNEGYLAWVDTLLEDAKQGAKTVQ